jgi:MFS family permease
MFMGYVFVFVVASGVMFLIPVMLSDATFGLQGQSEEETEGNIAKAFGLMSIPQGVCQVLVALALFVPVSNRLGELTTCLVFGMIAAVNFVLMGVLPYKLWHIAIHQTVTGSCFGFIVPILGPIIAKYASTAYPSQMAETQGIPILGMNLAMAFGQNIMAFILYEANMETAWIVCGVACVCFAACTCLAIARVDRLTKSTLGHLSSEQRKIQLATGGQDVDAFINAKCDQLRSLLEEKREHLWNGPVQSLISNKIDDLIPQFRAWDEATHGTEYLKDVRLALMPFPGELAVFEARFPEIEDSRAAPHERMQSLVQLVQGSSESV